MRQFLSFVRTSPVVVGAVLKTGEVELEDVTKMSRGSLDRELIRWKAKARVSPAADGVRPKRKEGARRSRSCMMQKGSTRAKVPRRVMFDLRALSSRHEMDEVVMDDGGSESQDAHRPRRVPTLVRQSSEVFDERNILVHSKYRSRCLHCVVGRGVGQRHVAFE